MDLPTESWKAIPVPAAKSKGLEPDKNFYITVQKTN
jgi:hypothetical protein